MIKLYTYQEFLTPENRSKVFPLLFDLCYYEKAASILFEKFQLVETPEEAHFLIFPLEINKAVEGKGKKAFQRMLTQAKYLKKKLWVYTGGDYGRTFQEPEIMTLRFGGFKTTNASQTYICPTFIEDPIGTWVPSLTYLPYQAIPEISFTGYASGSRSEWFLNLLAHYRRNFLRLLKKDLSDKQSFFPVAFRRNQFLKKIQKDSRIRTHFILRKKYRAGAHSEIERKHTTQEFFQNMIASPYTFCLRGAGNFSVRFYESLACGRIPVLLDTDVSLPLESIIPWNEHICRVNPKEDWIEQIVAFHSKMTEEGFVEMQKNNRKLYQAYLIRHHYFCYWHQELKKFLKT
tara:strand:- start:31131 stop:32168 length:1038 start_codon:yes stop_codon:yes gene_type:complete